MEKSNLIDSCLKKRLGEGSEVFYVPPSEDLKDGLYISLSNPQAEITEDSQDSFSRDLENIFLKKFFSDESKEDVDMSEEDGDMSEENEDMSEEDGDMSEENEDMSEENEGSLGNEENKDFNQEKDETPVVTHENYSTSEELLNGLSDQQSAAFMSTGYCSTSKKNVENFDFNQQLETENTSDAIPKYCNPPHEFEDISYKEQNKLNEFVHQQMEEKTSEEIADIFGDNNELEMLKDREKIQAYNARRKLREDHIERSKVLETSIHEKVQEKESENIFVYKGHEIDLDKDINVIDVNDDGMYIDELKYM